MFASKPGGMTPLKMPAVGLFAAFVNVGSANDCDAPLQTARDAQSQ
jgi:hypothetical protein